MNGKASQYAAMAEGALAKAARERAVLQRILLTSQASAYASLAVYHDRQPETPASAVLAALGKRGAP